MKKIKLKIPAENFELGAQLDLADEETPKAYALFAHCFTCTKDLKSINYLNEALTNNSIAVLRFDFTGLGESEGEFGTSNIERNISDIVAAAEYLKKNYEAPKLLVGHSLGGAAIMQAAPQIPSAKALATIGAAFFPFHIRRILKSGEDEIREKGKAEVMIADKKFTISEKFYDDLNEVNMKDKIENLNKALCILHSPLDKIVGIDHAAKIFISAKHPKSFISLDQADHLLFNKKDALYAGNVISTWASKYIF